MTHEQTKADAQRWIERTRRELLKLEDIIAHAEGFRGTALSESAMRCWQSADNAVTHALQLAIAKRTQA